MYFRRLLKCGTLGNNLIHTSVRRPAFVQDVYKVLNYEAPFNEDEKLKILEVLNSPFEENITKYATKIATKNIISHRVKNGDFSKVENLLDVQKFGPKSLEKLCQDILEKEQDGSVSQYSNNPEIQKLGTFFRDFKPKPKVSLYRDGEKTIIGVKVVLHSVTWSKIDKNQNLQSWGIIPAITNTKSQSSFVHDKVFETTRKVLNEIPVGDYYILEDMIPVMPKDSQFMIKHKLNLASFRTSLITQLLLRGDRQAHVHSIKPSSLDKMFDLKLGADRMSMGENLKKLTGPTITGENPFLTHISEELWNKFINERWEKREEHEEDRDEGDSRQHTSNLDREMLANSLLLSVAFNSLVRAAENGLFKM